MINDVQLSLSYQQRLLATQALLAKCDLRHDGRHFTTELEKAMAILDLWYTLALNSPHGTEAIFHIQMDYHGLKKFIWPDAGITI
ncbi:hypothetical protein [Citrobacter koseri]|uniref:hypothetical protein n=1 Tax=Citrobacter koseri TaxID=545 RepID=UPI0028BF02B2|nr:hypothetical protein [Citrobacter koseri]MDT7487283.1 hypothetical protein [Citrobacter koseri]